MIYLVFELIAYKLGINYAGNYMNLVSAILLGFITISFAYWKVDVFSNILKNNDMSYGVYIYHMVVVHALITVGLDNPTLNVILTIVITSIFAFLSWKLVENPILNLKR